MQIRDIDKLTQGRQIHLKVTFFLHANTNPQELIAKGFISAPLGDEALTLSMLDGNGIKIDDYPIYTGPTSVINDKDEEILETPFTVRIPDDGKTYCLVATSSAGNKSGFYCFDPTTKKALLGNSNPLFYKVSLPGYYRKREEETARKVARTTLPESLRQLDCKFSIVVPLFNTPIDFLHEMILSVTAQIYPDWELILVNASPENKELRDAFDGLSDSRIKVIDLTGNLGIAENTNAGIKAASGDYIMLFDHDDLLVKNTLMEYARYVQKHPDVDVIYCDEDFLDETGKFVAPHFKSDFNIDLLRCHNYITHLLCVRSDLMKRLLLRTEYNGAQDYDLILRLAEETDQFGHIQEVLYHWRMHDNSTAKSAGNKNYADENGRKALQGHLDRLGLDATASLTNTACFYHVSYNVAGNPLVSIIIPNKDNAPVLRRCVESILDKTSYGNYEIVIVENGSDEKATFELYGELKENHENIKILEWDEGFNYSAINNYGVSESNGEFLVLLNNDTEVISPDWLDSMLSLCQREDVGIVGAKLIFPDETIQHAGVLMIKCLNSNMSGGPVHVFQHLDRNDPGYMRRAALVQDLSAVTAACLMTKRSVYEAVGGLDESFVVAFNDVDFCLKVRSAGYLVVYDPDAQLYHYESLTRGTDNETSGLENYSRFLSEQGKLRAKWPETFAKGDEYHSPASTEE